MWSRGELWVIAQLALFVLFILVPDVGAPWPQIDIFSFVGWFLCLISALIFLWSVVNLGRMFTPFPRPVPEGELITSGVYRLVRHPIYFAVLLVTLGLSLVTQSSSRLIVTLMIFLFLDRKATREEAWLQEKYPKYAEYKTKVKKLLPGVY